MSAITLPIDAAERDLRALLENLSLGETVTWIGSEGVPQASVVSLKPISHESPTDADWDARWDALAGQESEAWRIEKNAVELLSETRRSI
jgi:hypothetical protein